MIAPPQELIYLDKLEKCFGVTALLKVENIRLDVATAYVLTGMNGAGKTVFLRILAGLEKADVVNCRFMGRTVRLHPYPKVMRDAIVYVHQHPIIFNMSVEKNIAYGLRVRGLSGSEIMRRTHEAMEWAELSALRSRMPNGLSGGEKQKIALARAKILQPKLLLLDEPSANLDGKAREQVIALIPALVAEGTSVVVACHDRDLIHLQGIHHLKLRDGKIEDRGIKI